MLQLRNYATLFLLVNSVFAYSPIPVNNDTRFFRVWTDSHGSSWFRRVPSESIQYNSSIPFVNNSHFLSQGITCIHLNQAVCKSTGRSIYVDAVKHKYNTSNYVPYWVNSTLHRMAEWGFNTAGAWSYGFPAVFHNALPYVIDLGLNHVDGTSEDSAGVMDFFDPKFLPGMVAKMKSGVASRVNDTNLLGYFFANEVWWGSYIDEWPITFRETDTILLRYLNLSDTAGGFFNAVRFLKAKYNNNLAALNAAWRISANSFETIKNEMPFYLPSETRVADERVYLRSVAEYFFSHCHAAIRSLDTNHLILGSRYSFWELPLDVVTVESAYTDVTSYNGYQWIPGMSIATVVSRIAKANGGKPILISEFGFRAEENNSDDWNVDGDAGFPVVTQQEKADQFTSYIKDLMVLPYVVGYHMWKWVDDPPHTCGNDANSNYGLVDIYDQAYPVYTSAVRTANSLARGYHTV